MSIEKFKKIKKIQKKYFKLVLYIFFLHMVLKNDDSCDTILKI